MYGKRRLLTVASLLLGLWILGITGYVIIEDWNVFDAVYMTTISLTTVGYAEVHPLSQAGRIFTALLITLGVGFFFYALSVLAGAILEGHLKGLLGKKKMEKTISKLKQHFIICGCGRIGMSICRVLKERHYPLVVIENDPSIIQEIEVNNLLYVKGNATHDEILIQAGVERAKGIICVLSTDADNVYITLTARSLNPGLSIVARADDARAENKMIQAGANRVISPYEIGASRMALAVLQPTVTEFLDLAVHSPAFELSIEQVEIDSKSSLNGVSLIDSALRQKLGVTVLAVRQSTGEMTLTLPPDYIISGGDIVVALGSREGLNSLRELGRGMLDS
ncbi:MAG: potassium channel protein [Deltaproteobacteria bacterium]|nr:potassium channel protein [Deltaproteobacteria bacterium]MBW1932677.1 potassium channel protein [Deltaproteobacteria bacterium]MBW1938597.1 potassium channel protein [Deltaproteobacteria bacterium]MBW1964338.1 potassium channel protein [Deltaproteobacteria bacterium]MBW2080163.1 potassium channel protein [Deltaproteobacteria bacterium]